jgi:hypothetical protein
MFPPYNPVMLCHSLLNLVINVKEAKRGTHLKITHNMFWKIRVTASPVGLVLLQHPDGVESNPLGVISAGRREKKSPNLPYVSQSTGCGLAHSRGYKPLCVCADRVWGSGFFPDLCIRGLLKHKAPGLSSEFSLKKNTPNHLHSLRLVTLVFLEQ